MEKRALKIGEVYRTARPLSAKEKVVDGLSNYYYYTDCPFDNTTLSFERGIFHPKKIKDKYGEERYPVIIISSSPHRYGSELTPWEDSYDPDYGYVSYYGDNKYCEVSRSPEKAQGNAFLLEAFKAYNSSLKSDRENAIPIVMFERVKHEGRTKGNIKFQGFGIIENIELVTQYDDKNNYFSNYLFDICVFSMTDENEEFDWQWINDRRNPELSLKETMEHAPKSWKNWINKGSQAINTVRRRVSSLSVVKVSEQLLDVTSNEWKTLEKIYNHYKKNEHGFELLAMNVTEQIYANSNIKVHPGWVTTKSGDGGVDYVLRLDIDQGLSGTKIVVLGQAKCEKLTAPTNGVHIARTVARLKRGWLGAYVTTSYFTPSVQQEVIEDQYPIMLINGKKVVEVVNNILKLRNISLEEYLLELDSLYPTKLKNKRADEILRD